MVSPELNTQNDIEAIIAPDRIAFKDWVKDPSHHQQFQNMPHAALRYVLISPRIFELVNDPTSVDILTICNRDNQVSALIYERRKEAVTPPERLERYMAEKRRTRLNHAPDPLIPKDVDPFLVYYNPFIQKGIMQLSDFVINDINLLNIGDSTLYVAGYSDREVLQRKGVGKGFYKRLRECATEMGFKFITGSNDSENITFFTDVIGRYPLSSIKSEYHEVFYKPDPDPDDSDTPTPDSYTVDILSSGDREKYLIEHSSWVAPK